MPSGRTKISPKSVRGLSHVTPKIFGIWSNISPKLLELETSNLIHGFVWAMPSRRTKIYPKSGRGLGHVTPTIFGSTVGYPSGSLASCYLYWRRKLMCTYYWCEIVFFRATFMTRHHIPLCLVQTSVAMTIRCVWSWMSYLIYLSFFLSIISLWMVLMYHEQICYKLIFVSSQHAYFFMTYA